MVKRVLLFPFWLVKSIVMLVVGLIRIVFVTLFRVLKFVFAHALWTGIGGVIGYLIGRKVLAKSEEEDEWVGEPEQPREPEKPAEPPAE